MRLTIAGAAFWALSAGAANSQNSSCIFESSRPSVMQIEYRYDAESEGVGIQRGTGFIISSAGHVITNAHVVRPSISGLNIRSETITARIGSLLAEPIELRRIATDAPLDLAVLQLPPNPHGQWRPIPVAARNNLTVGAPVVALGFAGGADLAIVPPSEKTAENTVLDGEIRPWWQTGLALGAGNSGGPVFGELGTVVGIAVAIRRNANLVSFVLPIFLARDYLDLVGATPILATDCGTFPECEHESHGIAHYRVRDERGLWGPWRRGGDPTYNSESVCRQLESQVRSEYPLASLSVIQQDENSRDVGFRQFEYRFFCSIQILDQPAFNVRRSRACLR